jgi:MinD-like ATPase involved in chromosome partitioning or flagellar assembly
MGEPEVALVFTPEEWVEELHRHLTDHGGARVRQIVVEPEVALEESYDVLVVSNRWPALTSAFVTALHARGRVVLGVFAREEPAARAHLSTLRVDAVIESDRGPHAFVEALVALRTRRTATVAPAAEAAHTRAGRIVVVGGPAGAGRTEIAVHLAAVVGDVLVDADDVAPSVAARLGLDLEPNLRTAIDAVEHRQGDVSASLVGHPCGRGSVLTGLPSAAGWTHVRTGEVVRVVETLVDSGSTAVVDLAASLEDLATQPRGRNAIARALVLEADVIVGVCAATPVGVTRFLSWAVEVIRLAPERPVLIAVNRVGKSRFRRGEIYEELTRSLPRVPVEFLGEDARVGDAAWDGTLVRTGPFTRAIARVGELVNAVPRRPALVDESIELES